MDPVSYTPLHQSAGLPSQQPLQDGLARSGMVVFVVAHQGLFDLKVIQQLHRDPGVLRGDEVQLESGNNITAS